MSKHVYLEYKLLDLERSHNQTHQKFTMKNCAQGHIKLFEMPETSYTVNAE